MTVITDLPCAKGMQCPCPTHVRDEEMMGRDDCRDDGDGLSRCLHMRHFLNYRQREWLRRLLKMSELIEWEYRCDVTPQV